MIKLNYLEQLRTNCKGNPAHTSLLHFKDTQHTLYYSLPSGSVCVHVLQHGAWCFYNVIFPASPVNDVHAYVCCGEDI